MVSKFFPNLNNSDKGITLIEIIVVILIITMFSSILISNFPQIQREYALSRAAYKLAQNLRRTQDLSLSGVATVDDSGQLVQVKGYGLYIDLRTPPTQQYIIYGDSCPLDNPDFRYTVNYSCQDYIISTVNVNEDKSGVFIKTINNIDTLLTSINFSPPNPYINIDNLSSQKSNIEIVLALSSDPSVTRAVSINTSGLIEVK